MSQPSTRIALDLGDEIQISPPIWPNHELSVQPGDLSQFAPQGNGIYGYQGSGGSPFAGAPPQDPHGGVIYFDARVSRDDFEALMRVMGVERAHVVGPAKDFAVFTAESQEPGKNGYLAQMRIVSKFGLRYMFGAITSAEYDTFPEQETTVVDALWAFMEQERRRWGTFFLERGLNSLQGLFGGDSYFSCEQLAFGFMVENDYHHVYRIWSRAWLVTK